MTYKSRFQLITKSSVLLLSLCLILSVWQPVATYSDSEQTLSEIQNEITDISDKLTKISDEKEILEEQVAFTESEIQRTEGLIGKTEEVLRNLEVEIQLTKNEIHELNMKIKDIVRQMQLNSNNNNSIASILQSENIGEALSNIFNLSDLNSRLNELRDEKVAKEKELETKLEAETKAKFALEESKVLLRSNQDQLNALLEETNGDQKKYEEILAKKREEEKEMKEKQLQFAEPTGDLYSAPAVSDSGEYILPVPLEGSRTSRCTIGHGYPACDFPNRSLPPIWAAKGGTVTTVKGGCAPNYSWGCNGGYGNYLILSHDDGKTTLYAHFNYISVGSGQTVAQGEVLGQLGNSGSSTGPHLHFEIREGGFKLNPRSYLPQIPPCESWSCW
jgi:murein DD-endopeptidase MepM/ murein hydrolase activator NlpD